MKKSKRRPYVPGRKLTAAERRNPNRKLNLPLYNAATSEVRVTREWAPQAWWDFYA